MDWTGVIKELIAALRKFAAPFLAFFAGKSAQKKEDRIKNDKATIEDLERRLDAARDIDRASRDDAERERVRSRYTKPDPPRP